MPLYKEKDGLMACNCCGEVKKDMEIMPTFSQLVFGGFPSRMELRCPKCDKKVFKKLEKMLMSKKK